MDPSSLHLPAATEVHTAPAANPTPSSALNHSINHPPYAEMITAAIGALNERNGSSKIAIAKYIESTYTNLPPAHSALLTHHLKRLKSSGVLQMVKYSYKLKPLRSNGAAAADPTSGPKRGRGRPPKNRPVPNPDDAEPTFNPNPTLVALGLVDEPMAPPSVGPKRSPGRPRKPKVGPAGVGSGDGVKRRSGRPPKYRPVAAEPGSGSAGVKRGRGRPRKEGSSPLETAQEMPSENIEIQALSVKRRGRPARVGGARKPRKLTGRPVGRPKKNVVETGMQPPPQWASPNLKMILVDFQSKIKQAVGVLKPLLANHTSISAASALQDLEQLTVTDISAQFAAQEEQELQQGPEQFAVMDISAPFAVQEQELQQCPEQVLNQELLL